jgi:hypothetical protein
MPEEFQAMLQRLSGTKLDAQGAANALLGTTGIELQGALNRLAGYTGHGLQEVTERMTFYGFPRTFLPPVGNWMEAPGVGNRGTATPTLNELRVSPWFVPEAATWDRVGHENKTAGGAGSIMRIGIYRDNGSGYPSTLYWESPSTLDSTATGMLTHTVSLTIPAGLYWVGAVAQVAAPGWETMSNFNLAVNTQDPAVGSASAGYSHSGVTGAFPATFTSTFFSTSGVPVISFRRSA